MDLRLAGASRLHCERASCAIRHFRRYSLVKSTGRGRRGRLPDNDAWAFVLSGRLEGDRNFDGYLVSVRNLRTDTVMKDRVRNGYFAGGDRRSCPPERRASRRRAGGDCYRSNRGNRLGWVSPSR